MRGSQFYKAATAAVAASAIGFSTLYPLPAESAMPFRQVRERRFLVIFFSTFVEKYSSHLVLDDRLVPNSRGNSCRSIQTE